MIAFVRKDRDFFEVIEMDDKVKLLVDKGIIRVVDVPLKELLTHSIIYKGEIYRDIINLYTSNTDWECLDITPSNMSDDDIDKFIEMLDEFRAPLIRMLDIIYNQPGHLIYLQWQDSSVFEPLQTKEDKEGNLLIETEYQDKPIRADAIYYDRVKEVFVTPEGACFEIFKLYDKKAIEDITNV